MGNISTFCLFSWLNGDLFGNSFSTKIIMFFTVNVGNWVKTIIVNVSKC